MSTKFSSLFFLLLLPFTLAQSPVKSAYWFPGSGFPASSIDSTLFTHLLCAFASLDANTTLSIPSSFSAFTSTVRARNPSVLTLLSIGGGSANQSVFSSMASSPSTRRSFIDSSIQLARANGFSGLDLDWQGDGWTAADMSNLATLLSEWRSAAGSESRSSGKARLLLTAALAVTSTKDGFKYPVNSIGTNLDWVNVMDYDYYAPGRTAVTAAHAALYSPSGGPSGSAGVADWINSGLPASKIVLGLPYYGYAWNLTDPNNHGLGAPASGPASGPGIDSDGAITFSSVRSFIRDNGATTAYDATVKVNYCYAGSTWIGYDDVESIEAKVAFVKGRGLRGDFAWSVSGDDGNWTLSKNGAPLAKPLAPLAKPHKSRIKVAAIIASLVFGILILFCICCFLWKRKRRQGVKDKSNDMDGENSLDLPLFDFQTIVSATDNFSAENKLGQGGFGPVYKGKLGEDQEVAVKRLCKTSQQGVDEFKNEVILIAKLQHRNLVRLLGCCIHREERMLIYEYMPNKSLDAFLFGKDETAFLSWRTRYQIIIGITRGLLYLHQDSRFRIIHRDLKASNILLDKDMIPKISDFGMARIFEGDETNFNTRKVVGTYGYMSPEYALEGTFSMKSDVFSFGVLVLEIVSGLMNRGLYAFSPHLNLLAHAWSLWSKGDILQLVHEEMSLAPTDEVLKCIKIGLLCVQERVEDRPLMSNVIEMFGSDVSSLPQPNQPGFVSRFGPLEIGRQEACSLNGVTITELSGR